MNSKAFFGGVVVSPEADMVARELIHELHIPKLHNLAFLLEINKCFDDHQGIHYRWNKIDQLESFYFKVKDLFPRQFWHLLGQDLLKLLDTKKQPLLLKLAKSSTTEHPTTQEDYVRLQLYSTKERKALAAFKFCLHLACIGKPQSLELQVEGLEITTCC